MNDNIKAQQEFASRFTSTVLKDDWEESSDFYPEAAICRKLTKLIHLKNVNNKYTEVQNEETT